MNLLKKVSLSILFLSYAENNFAKQDNIDQGFVVKKEWSTTIEYRNLNGNYAETPKDASHKSGKDTQSKTSFKGKEDFHRENGKRKVARMVGKIVGIGFILSPLIAFSVGVKSNNHDVFFPVMCGSITLAVIGRFLLGNPIWEIRLLRSNGNTKNYRIQRAVW